MEYVLKENTISVFIFQYFIQLNVLLVILQRSCFLFIKVACYCLRKQMNQTWIVNNFRTFCKPVWSKEWFICQPTENKEDMTAEILTEEMILRSVCINLFIFRQRFISYIFIIVLLHVRFESLFALIIKDSKSQLNRSSDRSFLLYYDVYLIETNYQIRINARRDLVLIDWMLRCGRGSQKCMQMSESCRGGV